MNPAASLCAAGEIRRGDGELPQTGVAASSLTRFSVGGLVFLVFPATGDKTLSRTCQENVTSAPLKADPFAFSSRLRCRSRGATVWIIKLKPQLE